MTARSEFSQIANSAEQALVNNASKTLFVNFNSVSISCRGNLLSLSSPDASYSSALNGYCNFTSPALKGQHHLTFIPMNGTLTLRVDD